MPAVALLAAEVVLALVCLFLIATSKGYQYTFGAFLNWIVKELRRLPSFSIRGHGVDFGDVAAPFEAANKLIQHMLGVGIDATTHALAHVGSVLIRALTYLGEVIEEAAVTTERAFLRFQRYVIPAMIEAALGPIGVAAYFARDRLKALAKAGIHAAAIPARYVVKKVTEIEHRTVTLTRTVYKTVTVAAAGAVAGTLPRIKHLERDWEAIKARLRRLEKPAAVVGVGAIAGAVLGKLGLGWTRCSKVGRVGKAVCGMDEGLLESFLQGALVIAGSISIVELARECQAFTPDVDDAVRFFVREAA